MIKALISLFLSAVLAGTISQGDAGTSVSVIGGADGPTSVFIAGKLGDSDDHLSLQMEDDENGEIAFLPLSVYLRPVAYENGQLEMVIDNQSGSDYYYGREYMLQKKDGEEWIDVEPEIEYGWPKISLMVKDTETAAEVYDLTVFGELGAGTYKLVKNDLEAEFTLVDNSEDAGE